MDQISLVRKRTVKALGAAPAAWFGALLIGAAAFTHTPVHAQTPASPAAAAKFLTQASFGATQTDVDFLMSQGYAAWIDRQFTLPATSHRTYWEMRDAMIKASNPTAEANTQQVVESFWKQAATSEDQLRLRVAYALSQIFVISSLDSAVNNEPRAIAAWLDMLGSNAFGSYRQLLENVALHPLMGIYLSHLRNQKADPVTGRVADQNFAREVMQLFSIGVVRLNLDGTPVLVGGNPVETYGPDDVAGLAKVFTGFSFACVNTSGSCFFNGISGGVRDPDRWFKPMQGYPQYHSTEAKSFLGVTIAPQATANPSASLNVALDTLAAHPNVGPFMAGLLIQRLVTSNPTPNYVRDIAQVFNNNGSGQRGDLKAVVRAILLHPEARLQNTRSGKLREPVLRLSAYLRAFPHSSDSGFWRVGYTDDPGTALGQTPLRSPSVFNFYRPGYTAPGSQSAAAGLLAPEFQLINESSVAGWVNYMRDNLNSGIGNTNGTLNGVVFNRRDVQRNWAPEMALATNPQALTNSVANKLLFGSASPALLNEVSTAIAKINIPALNAGGTNQSAIDSAKFNRVKSAVLLMLASSDFIAVK